MLVTSSARCAVTRWLLAGLLVPAAAHAGPPLAEVAFDFHERSVIVQATLAGAGPFEVLLDTGVNPSAIDTATARALGLVMSGPAADVAGGGAGRKPGRETRFPQVGLGALQASDVAALALDLPQIRDTLHPPIRAALGYSLLAVLYAPGSGHDDERRDLRIGNAFLQDCVLTINYPQRLIGLQCAPGR